MKIVKKANNLYVNINLDEPVNRHRPSVDYFFKSVAEHLGHEVVALLLTGMGKDGAAGLLDLKNRGAFTICQDEQSSVVFGMPKEGIRLGGAKKVLSLDDMPQGLLDALDKKKNSVA